MKKIVLSFVVLLSACAGIINVEALEVDQINCWDGFYIGENFGYWWSNNDSINTSNSVSYINPLFLSGATDIANALNIVATNNTNKSRNGFIGGGQFGFNYQSSGYVFGIDADLDGLSNSNSTSHLTKVVPLVNYPETYTSTFSVTKKINHLGTVRGRVGFLWSPSILFYGIGGLAYGNVEFDESFYAQESFSTFAYPRVIANDNYKKTRAGWTLGAGVEWMFQPQWSVKLEYAYYDLGTLSKNYAVTQFNNLAIPAAPWAIVNVHSSADFALSSIRVGFNYHHFA